MGHDECAWEWESSAFVGTPTMPLYNRLLITALNLETIKKKDDRYKKYRYKEKEKFTLRLCSD